MKTRTWVAVAALALWGWQTGHPLVAIVLAGVLASSQSIDRRWILEETDFQRIADVTSVIFVGLVVMQFSDDTVNGIFNILEWMPVVLAPLMIAQRFSSIGGVPLSALFASMRRTRGTLLEQGQGNVDLTLPFILVCVVAASAGSGQGPWFPLGAGVILAATLLPSRRTLRGQINWVVCVALASGMAILVQNGLYSLQERTGQWITQWIQDAIAPAASPNQAFTAIGMIGRLKFSDRVRLRVQTPGPLDKPLLLRESSYTEFRNGTWRNTDNNLTALDPVGDTHFWRLGSSSVRGATAVMTAPIRNDVEVLPLPPTTLAISGNEILAVQRHASGAVLVDTRPGYLRFEIEYRDELNDEPPPRAADLLVPENYTKALQQIAAELGELSAAPSEKVRAVESFFRERFTYSLVQKGRPTWTHPLNDFLLNRRSGHCEYFASGTALLLRALGIPARYAVGYSVSEYSAIERQYIARQRDAHAWVIAYIDGRWRTVDTTPDTWRAEEDEASGGLSVFSDLGAWLSYRWSRLRAGDAGLRKVLPWLLPPLVAVLLWRLRRTQRIGRGNAQSTDAHVPQRGSDSEFFHLIDRLRRKGLQPKSGETLKTWMMRVAQAEPGRWERIERLLDLHYRYRFDPRGLTAEERASLRLALKVVD